jgi:hypothetical protein
MALLQKSQFNENLKKLFTVYLYFCVLPNKFVILKKKDMQITEENSIRLIIKKCFADEIKKGLKVREYRDVTPYYTTKLYKKSNVAKEGFEEVTENNGKKLYVKMKQIQYIVFQIGYTKDTFITGCKGIAIVDLNSQKLPQINENDLLDTKHHVENPKPLYNELKKEYDGCGEVLVFSLGETVS